MSPYSARSSAANLGMFSALSRLSSSGRWPSRGKPGGHGISSNLGNRNRSMNRKEELIFIPLGILPLLHHPGTCGYPPPLCSETTGNGLVTETQQPPHAARAEHCDSVWSNSCNCSDGHWDYGEAAADWEDQIKSHLIREQYQIVIQEDDQKS